MPKTKDLIDLVLDKYGEDIIIREYKDGHPSISTGSLALDVSTGIGGVPLGRYTEFYGPEAGGKTTIALSIAKQALATDKRVLYVDIENALDFGYAHEILGDLYDSDKVLIVQPASGEDAFEISEAGIDAGYDLILFDSVAASPPKVELDEDDYSKQQVGLSPRLTAKFLRKTAHKIRSNEVAFVFTNQVRANIGSYFGGYTTPAGHALKHYTSLKVYISKSKSIEESGDVVGNAVKFIIKKNKLGIPYREAETNIIYGKGIDNLRDVLKFGLLLGVLKNRGPYYAFQDEVIGQGVVKSMEVLEKDEGRLDKIIEMCYNTAGVKYPPVRKGENGTDTKDG